MDESAKNEIRKNLFIGVVAFLVGLALGLYLSLSTGEGVRDNGSGIDAARRELERSVEREQRAAGAAHDLAGEAESLGDEIGGVREELEDAQHETGLALEGTDRADELIDECKSVIVAIRARGAADKESP